MSAMGERIRELRVKKGLEIEELATKLQVTRQTIWNWESGEKPPGRKNLEKLCTFFSVQADYFLNSGTPIDDFFGDYKLLKPDDQAEVRGFIKGLLVKYEKISSPNVKRRLTSR